MLGDRPGLLCDCCKSTGLIFTGWQKNLDCFIWLSVAHKLHTKQIISEHVSTTHTQMYYSLQ